jgi:hypothetical protein
MLQTLLGDLLLTSGYTQNQCDLNSIISEWYVDCRLDSQILVQELFYTGYGIGDIPTQTELLDGINLKLVNLYQYGLNYYFAGNTLVVSNSTCYDDFTNSQLSLNIGINLQINCN